MGYRDIYRAPAVRWGYDPKDQPVGQPAELYTKRGPLRARAPGLKLPVAARPVDADRQSDDNLAAHPS
jgi:hypothetical protein